MDESEKKKVLADLDVFVPDDDEENSGSSGSPRSASSKSFGGSGVADENELLNHGVNPTSCLPGDDNSSHVGTIDDASNNEVEIANDITARELRSATKKQRRKKHILYGVILLLCIIVIALAISLGVSSKKGQDYADQYSSAEYNTFNEDGGEEGPPPGVYPMQGIGGEDEELGTIVDIALGDERFSTLVAAVTAAGLSDILSSDSPFTLFAPTNEAFETLPQGVVDGLLKPENISQLQDILKYHVVDGTFPSSSLSNGLVETLNGKSVSISTDEGVMVNDSNVITADVLASNGVIHVIDKVLLPPPTEAVVDENHQDDINNLGTIVDIALGDDDQFSTLVAALSAADLVEPLSGPGPFTVFAPTNDAFANLPEGTIDSLLQNADVLSQLLMYHVVTGEAINLSAMDVIDTALSGESVVVSVSEDGTMLNDSNVLKEVRASNGIIYVIDKVLIPPEEEYTLIDWINDLADGEHEVPEDTVEMTPQGDDADSWSDLIDNGDCFTDMLCCFLFYCGR